MLYQFMLDFSAIDPVYELSYEFLFSFFEKIAEQEEDIPADEITDQTQIFERQVKPAMIHLTQAFLRLILNGVGPEVEFIAKMAMLKTNQDSIEEELTKSVTESLTQKSFRKSISFSLTDLDGQKPGYEIHPQEIEILFRQTYVAKHDMMEERIENFSSVQTWTLEKVCIFINYRSPLNLTPEEIVSWKDQMSTNKDLQLPRHSSKYIPPLSRVLIQITLFPERIINVFDRFMRSMEQLSECED